MKRLIRLNPPAGEAVYINPDHIVKVEPQPGGLAGKAKITLTTDPALVVNQTPDQVAEMIDAPDEGGNMDSSGIR